MDILYAPHSGPVASICSPMTIEVDCEPSKSLPIPNPNCVGKYVLGWRNKDIASFIDILSGVLVRAFGKPGPKKPVPT